MYSMQLRSVVNSINMPTITLHNTNQEERQIWHLFNLHYKLFEMSTDVMRDFLIIIKHKYNKNNNFDNHSRKVKVFNGVQCKTKYT